MTMRIELPVAIGTPFHDGVLGGGIQVGADAYAIVLPPKTIREHAPIAWNGSSSEFVEGATSYFDGYANTLAMAAAGSKLAQWALDLHMHIPAQDELEQLYRNFKPGTDSNWCYGRAGINLSATPPTYPYTPDAPKQTELLAFGADGPEAFELEWYWTSTQHAVVSDFAWLQTFGDGLQGYIHKSSRFRGCAVRRIKL